MNYENAIDLIQGHGRFHVAMLLILSIMAFMAALDMNSHNYLWYEPKYHCVSFANFDNMSWNANQCNGIIKDYLNQTVSHIKCRKWIFDKTVMRDTIVTEFNLVCDKTYIKTLLGTFYYIGLGIGNLMGVFGDKYGRRKVLIIVCGLEIAINVILPFLQHLVLIGLFRFMWGLTNSKLFLGICILMETLSCDKRSVFGNNFWMFWVLGYMTIPGIAYLFRDWRMIRHISNIAYIFYLLVYFIPESPRWLSCQNRKKEATASLIYIAKYNGVQLTENDFKDLSTEESEPKLKNLYQLRQMRIKMLVCLFVQTAICLAYFGLSIQEDFITTDIFLNVFIQGSLEIFTGPVGWLFSSKLSRKISLLVFYLITAVTLFVNGFASFGTDASWISVKTVFGSFGKFALSTTFCILDMYLAEIFPTVVRSLALFMICGVGSFGSVLAPWINMLSNIFVPIIFGLMCLVSGLLVWFLLPESKDCPLPQTMLQGEQFRRGNEINYVNSFQ